MRPSFEWDDVKNEQNKEKHAVSFFDAQYAFTDPHRVIIEDLGHSSNEDRFFCFGKETFEKCSILAKIKEAENFNHRNMLNISRIEI